MIYRELLCSYFGKNGISIESSTTDDCIILRGIERVYTLAFQHAQKMRKNLHWCKANVLETSGCGAKLSRYAPAMLMLPLFSIRGQCCYANHLKSKAV